MRNFKKFQGITTFVVTVMLLVVLSSTAFAAATHLVKDGEFNNSGFINAGDTVDGTIQGPGNWTQLNLGDASVDVPYLHVIMKATGDTTTAQIAVSDMVTFNLSDLGITLTEEYQDVIIPVGEKDIAILSWLNFTGLDGGSSVYTIKDIFLSEESASTLAVTEQINTETEVVSASEDATEQAATTDKNLPKTGNDNSMGIFLLTAMGVSVLGLITVKNKNRKQA